MSADYDRVLQEIGQETKRLGLDQSGYTFSPADEDAPIALEENEDEE